MGVLVAGRWTARGVLRIAGPLALLAALAALRGLPGLEPSAPAWLERAGALAETSRSSGVPLTELLAPREDPRVGLSLLLLRAGVPPAWVARGAQALAFAAAAVALGLLGFGQGRGGSGRGLVAAFLLAASPVFLEGVRAASPELLLGAGFLALATRAGPGWAQGALLAWGLGWSPWAYLTLLPLAAWRAVAGGTRRGDALLALGVGLGGAFLLNPEALMHPVAWARGLVWQGALEGIGRGGLGFALARGLWPLWGTLHLAGLALVAAQAGSWPRRLRAGEAAPLVLLAVVILGLVSGCPHDAPLLILLPWCAGEAAASVEALAARAGGNRRRRIARVTLAAVAIALPLAVTLQRAGSVREPAPQAAAIDSWLASKLPEGGLVAHDMGVAPSPGGEIRYLEVPFHAVSPESERGAYWLGWYGTCRAILVSERMVVRFLRRAEEFPDVLHFFEEARSSALEEGLFGGQPGARVHALLLPPDRPPLGEGWRERLARGRAGGLQGAFLARLGGELVRAGEPGAASELLEAALAAGYEEVGLYLNLANAQLALDRPLDAGRWLDEARAKHPDSPEVLYNLGIVLSRVGYWDRAVETLGRLRQLWPRSGQAAYLLGVALAQRGAREPAIAMLEEALRLDPRLPQREAAERALEALRGESRP